MYTSEMMIALIIQIGVIMFAVRIGRRIVRYLGIPSVLGELIAGIVIGPFALGGIPLPGFPNGLFFVEKLAGNMAVSPELYAFSTIGSIILLFSSGLETDLGLFLRYSLAGGIIGIGGVLVSFISGAALGVFLLGYSATDPLCLFLGVISTATSVGITARILSDQKKMDSPEGVTIMTAAVFDDVLGIIVLAVILGFTTLLVDKGGSFNAVSVIGIAGKVFGIWLVFTVLGLVFSKKIAAFLKIFKQSYDFSILSLGLALMLSGIFEAYGLAMIIGAYVMGLSLSKTDIAALIQERLHGLYEFFVPLFFAVMGMMVNVRSILSRDVLIFGAVYSVVAILSKIIGCGGPALLLGFNLKGGLRIGTGMVPRGEVALIIAGIGVSWGILSELLFSIIILMTLVTTLVAPPMINIALRIPGSGAKKDGMMEDSASASWEFYSDAIASIVMDTLLNNLKAEGFFVQMLNIDDGISQARKGDVVMSIKESENTVQIETLRPNINFVKMAMYEAIIELHFTVVKLKNLSYTDVLKKELSEMDGAVPCDALELIQSNCIVMDLKGETREEIIAELVQHLAYKGKLDDYDLVLHDVLQRENIMSTGMERGIAIPHAKTEGVKETAVAVGIKRTGADFVSVDGENTRIVILVVSPLKKHTKHIQFLATISAIFKDKKLVDSVVNAKTPAEIMEIFTGRAAFRA
ncbi:MAG: cation:proton antiporter [Spirochaetaceae bacterium]|jgi:fructose-specific phosphotransferase system IIA component|nr:cation:proton antiporter [Spirochaetaceae bacterium]